MQFIYDFCINVSSFNFGVTKRWSPKSLDLGASSFFVTPKSKDLGLQPYLEIIEDTNVLIMILTKIYLSQM